MPRSHLGYRKGKRSGVWFVRWRNHHTGANYKQAPVGVTNDVNDKSVEGALTFEQAVTLAREQVTRSRTEAAAQAGGPMPTVRTAVEKYISERNARDSRRAGREVRSDAGHRLRRYVLGQEERGGQKAVDAASLAAVHLHTLQEDDLLTWREELPVALKATTRQRLISDLKAALNAAWPRMSAEQKKLNPTFPSIVKDGFKAERIDDDDEISVARDNQILTDAQIATLLRAAREIDDEQEFEGDLYRIVVCLAATGARFAQARRMRVSDAQRDEQRLMVPGSYKGRGGNGGSVPVPVGEDVIEVLLPGILDRPERRRCSSDGDTSRRPVASFGESQNADRGRRQNLLVRGMLSASAQAYQKPFLMRCDIPASSAACAIVSQFSTLQSCTTLR